MAELPDRMLLLLGRREAARAISRRFGPPEPGHGAGARELPSLNSFRSRRRRRY